MLVLSNPAGLGQHTGDKQRTKYLPPIFSIYLKTKGGGGLVLDLDFEGKYYIKHFKFFMIYFDSLFIKSP